MIILFVDFVWYSIELEKDKEKKGEKGREACADEVKVERGSTGRKMREIDEGTMCLERKE